MQGQEYLQKEALVRKWLEDVLRDDLKADLSEALASGIALCHVMLKLDQTLIPSIHYAGENTAYKYRENLEFFVQAMEEYGVPQQKCFHPSDLTRQRNMPKVITSLIELARLAETKNFRVVLPPEDSIPLVDRETLSDTHKKLLLKVCAPTLISIMFNTVPTNILTSLNVVLYY